MKLLSLFAVLAQTMLFSFTAGAQEQAYQISEITALLKGKLAPFQTINIKNNKTTTFEDVPVAQLWAVQGASRWAVSDDEIINKEDPQWNSEFFKLLSTEENCISMWRNNREWFNIYNYSACFTNAYGLDHYLNQQDTKKRYVAVSNGTKKVQKPNLTLSAEDLTCLNDNIRSLKRALSKAEVINKISDLDVTSLEINIVQKEVTGARIEKSDGPIKMTVNTAACRQTSNDFVKEFLDLNLNPKQVLESILKD